MIYVLHDLKALDLDVSAAGFQVVVSGHSHEPSRSERDGVLNRESGKRRSAPLLFAGHGSPHRLQLPTMEGRIC